ncbi:MAG TPA: hypothetical protein VGE41_05070 [Verrucomicrobiae bacterium]
MSAPELNYLEDLRKTIQRLHGCDAKHLETVPVQESFRGKVTWEGDVEIFRTLDHPKAKQCFAWLQRMSNGSERYVAILGTSWIRTPAQAVQAFIMSDSGTI